MKLANQLQRAFPPEIRRRGEAYWQDGLVSQAEGGRGTFSCLVQGSEDDPYAVILSWKRGQSRIDGECTCPHALDGNHCKHLWAAILEMDRKELGQDLPRQPVLFRADAAESPRAAEEPEPRWYGGELRERSTTTGWRKELDQIALFSRIDEESGAIRGRVAWYEIDRDSPFEKKSLTVRFWQKSRVQSGLGKRKRLSYHPSEISSFEEESDRACLQLLTGVIPLASPYGPHGYREHGNEYLSATILPNAYDEVIPKLVETGRFGYFSDTPDGEDELVPVSWDNGEPYRLEIEVERGARHWELRGYLVRSRERRELKDAVAIFRDGLILFKDRLARHELQPYLAWMETLLRESALRVPLSQGEKLIERLSDIPRLPVIHWPEELRYDQSRIVPTPILSFRVPEGWRPNSSILWGSLAFRYGKREIAHQRAPWYFIDRQKKQITPRDLDFEQSLARNCLALGLKPRNLYSLSESSAGFEVSTRLLPKILNQLIRLGCEVQLEKKWLRPFSGFQSQVRSGIDWFQLNVEINFNGAIARLPEILEGLRRGERFVRLSDGSQGMLPEEWIQRWLPVLLLGKEEEGTLRFTPSQALLLDSFLRDQEGVDWDQKFHDIAARLGAVPREEAAIPAGFTGQLRDYQKEALSWLLFLNRLGLGGCLADDMGLGKTVEVLALLENQREHATSGPSLVVVPRSLVFNWMMECRKFTPRLKIAEYERDLEGSAIAALDIVVVTYGMLREHFTRLKEIPFHYVILDEAQAIKNPRSQTAKAARLLQARHRLVLTGTPIENHLRDFWSLFEFLNPGMLGSFGEFQGLFGGPNASLSDLTRSRDALTWLAKGLRPFVLRRTKEQVLKELPGRTEQVLFCELSSEERRIYDELRKYYQGRLLKRQNADAAEEGHSGIVVLQALLRLRQAACHPGLINEEHAEEVSTKLKVLLDQLSEVVAGGHKALVFSQFTTLLALVRRQVEKANIAYEYLDGATRGREAKVRRFQESDECKVFLLSLKAGGVGLNLTAADYVFLLDPWWNPAVESQAIDRSHRIGQERAVFAYRLIARGTVEERILELQSKKKLLRDAILPSDEGFLKQLTIEDLKQLLK